VVEETSGVAVIGGGSAGIGRATGRALALAGHRVVLIGRRLGPLEEAAAAIEAETGVAARGVVHDVADPDAAAALLETVASTFGPPDVLVLNAGGPPPGRILDLGPADWAAASSLLLLGPLRLAALALPGMAERGFGRVVVVTSTAVRRPDPNLAASVVLRSAMTAAAGLLSTEFAGSGVTVNCVAPGATATARRDEILRARAAATGTDVAAIEAQDASSVPAGRPGTPDEVAAAITFLASRDAGYITGTVLTVDGGKTGTI
jgi:3-oxoacyl-[acyl-carrier protein] reductase